MSPDIFIFSPGNNKNGAFDAILKAPLPAGFSIIDNDTNEVSGTSMLNLLLTTGTVSIFTDFLFIGSFTKTRMVSLPRPLISPVRLCPLGFEQALAARTSNDNLDNLLIVFISVKTVTLIRCITLIL